MSAQPIPVLTGDWTGYALLDSGNRRKLERFGDVVVDRAEPKAWWSPALDRKAWAAALARHEELGREGRWILKDDCPRQWTIRASGLQLEARLMDSSKQMGVFAEQAPHWRWLEKAKFPPVEFGRPRLLNLFGYTGVASLIAARAGFAVTHVDASKPAVGWGRRNQETSGLSELPIRWIIEDCRKFVEREIRRGNRYDAILLDPPAFGRGPKGDLWKVEENLPELLKALSQLLSDDALFVLMTLYSLEASATLAGNLITEHFGKRSGRVECGELALREECRQRLLSLSFYGCWSRSGDGPATFDNSSGDASV